MKFAKWAFNLLTHFFFSRQFCYFELLTAFFLGMTNPSVIVWIVTTLIVGIGSTVIQNVAGYKRDVS